MKPERIIISGGGTGGHIFPALAIADAFRKLAPGCDILFIGAEGRMEMEKVPAAGYPIRPIRIEGFNRKNLLYNLKVFYRLWQAIRESRRLIKDFGAHVVIGTGGFVSGPVLWAASQMGIPIVIQEQNSIPGLTNRLLSNKVKLVCTAYPGLEKYFRKARVVLTGNPVREKIELLRPSRAEGCRHFGLAEDKAVVLVYGGSQGARSLNLFMHKKAAVFADKGIQVIWQTGKIFQSQAEKLIQGNAIKGILALPFIDEMQLAYAAADLVVARAGAMTISELALWGKPSILVPLPTAANNHQYHNARALAEAHAAVCLTENTLPEQLEKEVFRLLADEKARHLLSEKIQGFARPRAAEAIVHAILNAL
jgi:UDP-N-acetylglucosamine--N-acetylmuramyl-(pentapeptide) pyrophosphoryl-undecaprenol N-acetylglucosamine transferase